MNVSASPLASRFIQNRLARMPLAKQDASASASPNPKRIKLEANPSTSTQQQQEEEQEPSSSTPNPSHPLSPPPHPPHPPHPHPPLNIALYAGLLQRYQFPINMDAVRACDWRSAIGAGVLTKEKRTLLDELEVRANGPSYALVRVHVPTPSDLPSGDPQLRDQADHRAHSSISHGQAAAGTWIPSNLKRQYHVNPL